MKKVIIEKNGVKITVEIEEDALELVEEEEEELPTVEVYTIPPVHSNRNRRTGRRR